jgi:hypothetical protein
MADSSILSVVPLVGSDSYVEDFENPAYTDLSPQYTSIVVLASSDQSGAAYVDQSIDGVNVSRTDTLAMGSDPGPQGGFSALLEVMVVLPFVRVRYTNGATAQSRFLLARRFMSTH